MRITRFSARYLDGFKNKLLQIKFELLNVDFSSLNAPQETMELNKGLANFHFAGGKFRYRPNFALSQILFQLDNVISQFFLPPRGIHLSNFSQYARCV